jgi:hypothetical protein
MNIQDTDQASAFNPFPEPQTIPSGWDTSVFDFTPQPFDETQSKPVPVEQADNSTESESNIPCSSQRSRSLERFS